MANVFKRIFVCARSLSTKSCDRDTLSRHLNFIYGTKNIASWSRNIRLYNTQVPDNMKTKERYTVVVEGNIGSGKTSFLQHFADNPHTQLMQEPVSMWRDVQGHNTLALMYEDPTRWSLTFQTYVQLTMLKVHKQTQIKPIKMMERSIYSAKYCFVENLHNSGKMPDIEYVVLTEWFDYLVEQKDFNVDLIVYLQTHPEVVHDRIKKRCRKEETTIPLDYLTHLHNLHEDWLVHKTRFSLPAPVLVIDANDDLPAMKKKFDDKKEQILFGYLTR